MHKITPESADGYPDPIFIKDTSYDSDTSAIFDAFDNQRNHTLQDNLLFH